MIYSDVYHEFESFSRRNIISAVPDVGQIMVFCQDKILNSYAATKELIERNDELRNSIPPLFIQMMRAPLYKIEVAFLPAFSTITWTSMKIPEFCKEVTKLLDAVQIFIKEVCIRRMNWNFSFFLFSDLEI